MIKKSLFAKKRALYKHLITTDGGNADFAGAKNLPDLTKHRNGKMRFPRFSQKLNA